MFFIIALEHGSKVYWTLLKILENRIWLPPPACCGSEHKICCFRFKPEWVQIITGKQEGVYGWFALNYLKGRLRVPVHRGSGSSDQPSSIASLDLGGSSLEVTYETQASNLKEQDVQAVTLAGEEVW